MQMMSPVIPAQSKDWVQVGSPGSTVTYIRTRLPAAVLTVLVMLLLKHHYSLATASELDWILAPTSRLVRWLTSANLLWESGVGYADFAKGIIVAPSCAGINFMIMAFGLAALVGLHHIRHPIGQLAWLTLAFAGAYGLTLTVNSLRIVLSMALYLADIYAGFLTVERVHRLAGVGIYLGALWLYFLALRPLIRDYCNLFEHGHLQRAIHAPGWVTPAWYLLIAVGVPVADRAWLQRAPSFVEHCATVVLMTLALCAVVLAFVHLLKILHQRLGRVILPKSAEEQNRSSRNRQSIA
jgi:exosortase K